MDSSLSINLNLENKNKNLSLKDKLEKYVYANDINEDDGYYDGYDDGNDEEDYSIGDLGNNHDLSYSDDSIFSNLTEPVKLKVI